MPANKVPIVTVPIGSFSDPSSGQVVEVQINQIFWRFLANLAAQFSGVDASLFPLDPSALSQAIVATNRNKQGLGDVPPIFHRSVLPSDVPPMLHRTAIASDIPPSLAKRLPVQFIFDTRANRASYPASTAADGTQYIESDHVGVVYVASGANWLYLDGIQSGVIASIPGTLGAHDAGFLYWASDYYHLYKWTGSVWTWGPGDPGNGGEMCMFPAAPTPAAAWKLLNGLGDDNVNPVGAGNPITYATETGVTASITAWADMTAGIFPLTAAAFNGIDNPATVPTTGANSSNHGIPSGAAVTTVAADGHTHTITLGGYPVPYMGFLPYLRR